MTLGRRAFLLIFPVVLAGYLVAAVSVYIAQGNSILALERARLTQRLDHAAALFRNEVSQSRSFLYSLLEGNAVRLFVSEADVTYRSNALALRLQQSIRSLSDDPKKFIAFAVINPDLTPGYYFENSEDPFAELSAPQIQLARRLVSGSQLRDWTFLHQDRARPLIVYSEFIDPVTFARPVPSAKRTALLVQVAIEPTQFLEMQKALQQEYGTELQFDTTPTVQPDNRLAASIRLAPSLFATLSVDADRDVGYMSHLKVLLGLGALAMSLFSVGLMFVLIRRFITDPISALDLQVTAVMSGHNETIKETAGGGEIARLTGNIRQLHDQSRTALHQVQRASWTDTLTGISNRAHFNLVAAGIVEDTQARDGHCALLFIDIDNFKFVNDKYGHEVGDDLLKTLAMRIDAAVRSITARRAMPEAVLARLSGDEFAVLLQSKPGDGTTREICAAIIALFSSGFEVRGKHYPVTASIGVAICPDDANDLAELISNADAAMYQAKTNGKNRSSRFSRALQDKRDRIRQIQEELRGIDADEQFHLVYMPIVDARGRVTGCEALLRWISPTLGNVTPDEFVPIAESSGLFTKIDWWVINRAMGEHWRLKELFGPETVLAINISSAELYSKSISDYFCDCLDRHGLEAKFIEIELTETFAVKLGDQLHRNIQSLRDKGFRISIDDFGAGYTSVQQIIEYTADTIKLDRALVQNLTGEHSLPALKAVIALCHAQNMAVVGEGVDTTRKMAMLTEAGCDHFQGYLISKPLNLTDLASWAIHNATVTAGEIAQTHVPARRAGATKLL
ncbi:putative bifunctional diguanylate cyclase/phosphodiesterase [Pararhizobium antarcticum]|uniref:Diguanylate phosphodiesterase n=1 Tax=Pararhizobium antarcticum TaxID=1798805 RepID=A0A657LTR8_9HYPH|nr:EAL domain-containing protein [Pararhizobium antarcticum]OJF94005.1 diguanylate phosphodiesterase [Pararhizobium antarcticum]OJF97501.1 diguanylate phosphodiesterase [Rhizobium sp. 58]